MTFRAEPVTDGDAALITALDRTLTWLRPTDPKRADTLIREVCDAFSTADGNKRLEGLETFTDIVLELLEIAQTNGSLSGLVESQEVTKSFTEVCAEMEEALMAFVSACDEDTEALDRIVRKIKQGTSFADVRLRSLMYAFNALPASSPSKASLFLDVIAFAVSVNLLELAVVPVLKKAENWPMTWPVPKEEKRKVYSTVGQALLAIDQTELAYKWLCRAIQLADDAVEEAAVCLRMAIASPTEFYFDRLMAIKAVQKLKGTPLHTVARIFLNGTVQEMAQAFRDHPELTTEHGLKEAACMRKIRVIAVANEAARGQTEESLCSKRVLKLSDLANIVGFSEEETEEACVSGVGHKLFSAKLDQLNKTIAIDSAMCREFTREDWQYLRARLEQWRKGLRDMRALL